MPRCWQNEARISISTLGRFSSKGSSRGHQKATSGGGAGLAGAGLLRRGKILVFDFGGAPAAPPAESSSCSRPPPPPVPYARLARKRPSLTRHIAVASNFSPLKIICRL